MTEQRDHVTRAQLPWRTDELTECGRQLNDVATDLTPWQRCLLHDIIAGQSLKADSLKIALTSRYATPNFPSNPTPPDSGGSQEFFLDDSENFGGMAW